MCLMTKVLHIGLVLIKCSNPCELQVCLKLLHYFLFAFNLAENDGLIFNLKKAVCFMRCVMSYKCKFYLGEVQEFSTAIGPWNYATEWR